MTRLARLALALYPPTFRERYGAELAALTEDLAPSWRHTLDLFVGAAVAWIRPSFAGPEATRARLQASVSTVWVAWCAGCLVVPSMTKALLDPPGPKVSAAVRALLISADVALVIGGISALLGAGGIVLRVLLPAVRNGHRASMRPLVPALVLALAETLGLIPLAVAPHAAGDSRWFVAGVAAWAAGLLALLVSAGLGPAFTIRRLRPSAALLRLPGVLAVVSAACLVVMTGACLTAAAWAHGDARLVGSTVPVVAVLCVGMASAAAAAVSSARALPSLRGMRS